MTALLYQTDSYLREFDATVTAVDETTRAVLLDRTAFYPGGGGQPHDLGTLSAGDERWPVVKVEKQGVEVAHILGGEAPLPATGAAGQRRARLGASLSPDAHPHGDARPLRGDLA